MDRKMMSSGHFFSLVGTLLVFAIAGCDIDLEGDRKDEILASERPPIVEIKSLPATLGVCGPCAEHNFARNWLLESKNLDTNFRVQTREERFNVYTGQNEPGYPKISDLLVVGPTTGPVSLGCSRLPLNTSPPECDIQRHFTGLTFEPATIASQKVEDDSTGIARMSAVRDRLSSQRVNCQQSCGEGGVGCFQLDLKPFSDELANGLLFINASLATADGGSVSKEKMMDAFAVQADLCNRGDVIFSDSKLLNDGGTECVFESPLSISSEREVALATVIPPLLDGVIFRSGERLKVQFPSRENALRFSAWEGKGTPKLSVVNALIGGYLEEAVLADDGAILTIDNKCVGISF